MGPVIETLPKRGEVHIQLPSWAWTKATDVFDQLLLPALLPAFAARGLRAFHASAVMINDEIGAMFAGPSGSGKTTSALLLISHGAKLVADDLLFIYREQEQLVMSGLGDGIRARNEVWQRFTQLRPGPEDASGKRRLGQDEVPWVRRARPHVGVLLGAHADGGSLPASRVVPALLSLCYHAGDEEVAVRSLAEMSERIRFYPAETAEEAATIAVKPVE
jgi:hypothetical protein